MPRYEPLQLVHSPEEYIIGNAKYSYPGQQGKYSRKYGYARDFMYRYRLPHGYAHCGRPSTALRLNVTLVGAAGLFHIPVYIRKTTDLCKKTITT